MKKKICLFGISATLLFSLAAVSGLGLVKAEEPTAYESLHSLIQNYYEGGVYKKDTNIYIDPDKVGEELSTYFHAKATSLEKTTYYAKDALWMSRGNGTYSYYGTSYKSDNSANGLTNGSATAPYLKPENASKILTGVNSMEDYYVTLYDFLAGTHKSAHSDNKTLDLTAGWEVNEGVYTSTSDDVIDAFRNFTAPLWLGKDATNANYIDYTKATVEEVGTNLVMKLWLDSTESDKLVDGVEADAEGNLLFSKAVITNAKQDDNNLQKYSKNLQAGLGTDFEGYSPETHPELFDYNSTISISSSHGLDYASTIVKSGESSPHGLWMEDNNGQNSVALQKNYSKVRLMQEEDGNVALRVGGKGQKSGDKYLLRAGLDVSEEVKNVGKYKAVVKVKAGPEANTIGSVLFKLYGSTNIYASGNKTDGFYYREDSTCSGTYSKTEWETLELEFEVTKKISVSDLCAVFVVYTNNSSSNANNYLLMDDFEIYKVQDQGTDFEGYDKETQSGLFPAQADTLSDGWKADTNAINAFYVQAKYQGAQLHEEDGNNSIMSWGSKEVHRFGININDKVRNPGLYKFVVKAKLGPNADNIGNILFRFHDSKKPLADDSIVKTGYNFSHLDYKASLSKDGWTTMEVTVAVTEEIQVTNELCIMMMVYLNGDDTYGTDKHSGNYVLFDDFEIYECSFE